MPYGSLRYVPAVRAAFGSQLADGREATEDEKAHSEGPAV
eukprot:IDg3411t1